MPSLWNHISHDLVEALNSQISKFEPFNIDDYHQQFKKYEMEHKFAPFCFHLIANLPHNGFKEVFSALGLLIHSEEEIFIEVILPYLVYYSIRFNSGLEVVDQITNALTQMMKGKWNLNIEICDGLGPQKHIHIPFAVLDLLKICEMMDRDSVFVAAYGNRSNAKELIFEHTLPDPSEIEDLPRNSPLYLLCKDEIIWHNHQSVNSIRMIIESIPKIGLSEAAESIKDYKRAAFYFEEYLREEVLSKTRKGLFSTKQIR